MRFVYAILLSTILSLSAFASQPADADFMGQPFLKEFAVYPNPSSGAITLTIETFEAESALQLKVYSLIGQEMMKETLSPFEGAKQMRLDLTHLPKGIYMVEISNGEKSRIKRISII